MSEKRVRCLDCGAKLTESSDPSPDARIPCPGCGSLARKIIDEISETIQTKSTVTATLSTASGQIVKVGTVVETESAQPIQPTQAPSIEEMPTDVIAEALQAQITLLPPEPGNEDGQWLGEVEVWGHTGLVGVGQLSDSVLEIADWLENLARRWQQARSDGSDSHVR